MKLGSLFDGSGGFPLAGTLHGIEPVWASEIEPFPIRVTKNRFPNMKHLGSVTDINGAEIEPVDIITFGSPCQDLSVAGKQAGIHEGQRSSLFFEAIRIIKEMRDHDRTIGRAAHDVRPRFAVWENVPGAFSSNKGHDFQAVLQALCEIEGKDVSVPMPPKGKWNPAGCIVGNGWSLAWRVYDAQFWGVPQRRKRIYLIADFGSERAGEILFEPESVCGDSAESGETREGTAEDAEGSTGRSDCYAIDHVVTTGGKCTAQGPCYYFEICPTLKASGAHGACYPNKARSLCARADSSPCVDRGQNVVVYEGKNALTDTQKAFTILSGSPDDHHIPTVCYAPNGNHCGAFNETDKDATLETKYHYGSGGDAAMVVYPIDQHQQDARFKLLEENSATPTLSAKMGTGGNNTPMILCCGNGQLHQTELGEKTGALNCMHDQQAVIYPGVGITSKENASNPHLVQREKPKRKYIVRRLTPTECARLQGFPDWWTDGVEGSDSAKYKLWGNGIALPCAADVLGRIAEELSK